MAKGWAFGDVAGDGDRAGAEFEAEPPAPDRSCCGDLELTYEAMQLPDSPGLTMFAFTAEPGTALDERLKLLGILTAD